eukprot:scaffold600290_cov18-Prasinocladus_malaysianus.AAC.1
MPPRLGFLELYVVVIQHNSKPLDRFFGNNKNEFAFGSSAARYNALSILHVSASVASPIDNAS